MDRKNTGQKVKLQNIRALGFNTEVIISGVDFRGKVCLHSRSLFAQCALQGF